MSGPVDSSAATLGASAQVYVTLRAAEDYAHAAHLRIEEARRELTERLLGARRTTDADNGCEVWRARSRTSGMDIGAMVSREGPLAVVIGVHVRGVPPRRPER